jgi:2-C-methyl-D-erythritol 4-phosphate cytidylyltransferase
MSYEIDPTRGFVPVGREFPYPCPVRSADGRTGAVAAGVVLASGYGSRVGAELNKVYLPLAGRRLLSWSLAALGRVPEIGVSVLVIRPQDADYANEVIADLGRDDVELVNGGATRQESELMALRHLAGRIESGQVDTVLIHDAARPLVSSELITAVLTETRAHGGAIPGLPRADLVAVDPEGDRVSGGALEGVVAVQTPQGFAAQPLLRAYEQADRDGFAGTDTASCMARYSDLAVRCIAGEHRNVKVTYPHDLALAEQVLAGRG